MLLRAVGLGLSPVFNARLTIASNVNNYNLSTALQALNWPTAKRARVEVTINAGVTVGSASTASPAFVVNLKDIDYVTIINNGNIFGAAGAGGGSFANSNGAPGGAGGTALQALSNVRVVNNGIIGGGGGGGGGAGAYARFLYWTWNGTCPRGGGWGNSNVLENSNTTAVGTCGRCGWVNGIGYYAAPCNAVYDYPASSSGVAGTAGSGLAGAAGNSPHYAGGAGGVAGAYYRGSNKITVLTAGTVRGSLVA